LETQPWRRCSAGAGTGRPAAPIWRGRERGDDLSVSVSNGGTAAAVVDALDVRCVTVDTLARVDSLGEHEDVAGARALSSTAESYTRRPLHRIISGVNDRAAAAAGAASSPSAAEDDSVATTIRGARKGLLWRRSGLGMAQV
jgi:hypothetical protein